MSQTAPERIWSNARENRPKLEWFAYCGKGPETVEYVRADLYEALVKKIEETQEKNRPFVEAVRRWCKGGWNGLEG